MARTDVAAAANARVGPPVVEYGVDPRGAGLFAALLRRDAAGRDGTDGTRVVDVHGGENAFGGLVRGVVQRFLGNAALGVARPVTRRVSTLPDERAAASSLDNVPLQIFAQRLARGQR